VYIVQALLLFEIAGRPTHDLLIASAAGAAAIAGVWLMVRNRILFGIIPDSLTRARGHRSAGA
jgi:hypothetical protein